MSQPPQLIYHFIECLKFALHSVHLRHQLFKSNVRREVPLLLRLFHELRKEQLPIRLLGQNGEVDEENKNRRRENEIEVRRIDIKKQLIGLRFDFAHSLRSQNLFSLVRERNFSKKSIDSLLITKLQSVLERSGKACEPRSRISKRITLSARFWRFPLLFGEVFGRCYLPLPYKTRLLYRLEEGSRRWWGEDCTEERCALKKIASQRQRRRTALSEQKCPFWYTWRLLQKVEWDKSGLKPALH